MTPNPEHPEEAPDTDITQRLEAPAEVKEIEAPAEVADFVEPPEGFVADNQG